MYKDQRMTLDFADICIAFIGLVYFHRKCFGQYLFHTDHFNLWIIMVPRNCLYFSASNYMCFIYFTKDNVQSDIAIHTSHNKSMQRTQDKNTYEIGHF